MDTSMTRPLFGVGEEVILVSKDSPDLNGKYTIKDIAYHKGFYFDKFLNKTVHWICTDLDKETPAYLLEELDVPDEDGSEIMWAQSALRKKYPPSEFTFDELMNNLKLETVG